LIYLVRALAAQRERSLAMFTLEHESATARAVRAWVMVFLFVGVSLILFIGPRFVQASFPAYDTRFPLPTPTPSSGVNPPTPSATPTPTALTMPALTSGTVTPAVETPTPGPTEPPTSAPTASPSPVPTLPISQGPLSGEMNVRFGDFGALVGWRLSSGEVVFGERLVLTLFWRGLEGDSPTNYTVFTHLISADGRLVAQHDGPPAGGMENTSEWDAGETIEDRHELAFKSSIEDGTGPATILVGLYDPEDVDDRVMNSEGQDYVTLPVTVSVVD
ncbi:MAG: hypothetical protein PVJ55_08620, partial [Anaerolineae bacterium]